MNQTLPVPLVGSLFKKETQSEQKQNFLSTIPFASVAEVYPLVTDDGIGLKINDHKFFLNYPKHIWQAYPKTQQQILSQNIAFCYTFFLPYLVPTLKKMKYHMSVPLADPFLFKGFSYAIPSIAFVDDNMKDRTTINLLRRLFEIDFIFSNKKTEFPKIRRMSDHTHAVLPFSFGKDSLLTLSLCRELGLKVYPVYIAEPGYHFEYSLKQKLARDFYHDSEIKVEFLENTLGVFRDSEGFVGWELYLTHYSLMLLPYVYAYNVGYVFFANEQSCNDTVTDKEGFRCNPVFEQSSSWILQNSLMASLIGGNSLTIGSLIEPLHEIAIIKILHNRYPEIAKYQMSCDPENSDKANMADRRWCENCSKCARIFIFLLANSIDPRRVGFSHNLLEEKYKSLFSVFGLSDEHSYGYDASLAGQDEQLLAFYLAYKNGAKGHLMELFEKRYLELVEKRAVALRKKYFGIHSQLNVPQPFRSKLLGIYREELDSLRW